MPAFIMEVGETNAAGRGDSNMFYRGGDGLLYFGW